MDIFDAVFDFKMDVRISLSVKNAQDGFGMILGKRWLRLFSCFFLKNSRFHKKYLPAIFGMKTSKKNCQNSFGRFDKML